MTVSYLQAPHLKGRRQWNASSQTSAREEVRLVRGLLDATREEVSGTKFFVVATSGGGVGCRHR